MVEVVVIMVSVLSLVVGALCSYLVLEKQRRDDMNTTIHNQLKEIHNHLAGLYTFNKEMVKFAESVETKAKQQEQELEALKLSVAEQERFKQQSIPKDLMSGLLYDEV